MQSIENTQNIERLCLISHPSREEIGEQLFADFEDPDRFGVYIAVRQHASDESDDPARFVTEVRIAPDNVERSQQVASFILRGHTEDHRHATVIVNPLSSVDYRGCILLGGVIESDS